MAKFYGEVSGNGQPVHRLGHRSVNTTAASWKGSVQTVLEERDGETWAIIRTRPWHDAGSFNLIYEGPLLALMNAHREPGQAVIHEPAPQGWAHT